MPHQPRPKGPSPPGRTEAFQLRLGWTSNREELLASCGRSSDALQNGPRRGLGISVWGRPVRHDAPGSGYPQAVGSPLRLARPSRTTTATTPGFPPSGRCRSFLYLWMAERHTTPWRSPTTAAGGSFSGYWLRAHRGRAARTFTRNGVRQKSKLEKRATTHISLSLRGPPGHLRTLNDLLDDDLSASWRAHSASTS